MIAIECHSNEHHSKEVETDELTVRLTEISEEMNQGEPFDRNDYLVLYTVGIIVPVVLMLIGWFM